MVFIGRERDHNQVLRHAVPIANVAYRRGVNADTAGIAGIQYRATVWHHSSMTSSERVAFVACHADGLSGA